jgi:hypothetical protein
MGHAGKDMSDLYDKIKEDVTFRRQWAERYGFGFERLRFLPVVPKFRLSIASWAQYGKIVLPWRREFQPRDKWFFLARFGVDSIFAREIRSKRK